MSSSKKVLITGVAGFIGFHLAQKVIGLGYTVTGIDNLNDYYDVSLKHSRLNILKTLQNFHFHETDLSNANGINNLFSKNRFECVINLAAQAGVRYSLINPHAYLESNLHGFLNILEACRHNQVNHLIYASSSSVYGANKKMPFSVHHNVDHPISLYAASKKSNELMAHAYSALYHLPTTGLRFFTVYGPFGRPDMALFLFTKAIMEGNPIEVFNHGKMKRDFTYVDDIVEAITRYLCHRDVVRLLCGPRHLPAPRAVLGNHRSAGPARRDDRRRLCSRHQVLVDAIHFRRVSGLHGTEDGAAEGQRRIQSGEGPGAATRAEGPARHARVPWQQFFRAGAR